MFCYLQPKTFWLIHHKPEFVLANVVIGYIDYIIYFLLGNAETYKGIFPLSDSSKSIGGHIAQNLAEQGNSQNIKQANSKFLIPVREIKK